MYKKSGEKKVSPELTHKKHEPLTYVSSTVNCLAKGHINSQVNK